MGLKLSKSIVSVTLPAVLDLVMVGCTPGQSPAPQQTDQSSSQVEVEAAEEKSPEEIAMETWDVPQGFTKINAAMAIRAVSPEDISCSIFQYCWVYEVVTALDCDVMVQAVLYDQSGRVVDDDYNYFPLRAGQIGVAEFGSASDDAWTSELVDASCSY